MLIVKKYYWKTIFYKQIFKKCFLIPNEIVHKIVVINILKIIPVDTALTEIQQDL